MFKRRFLIGGMGAALALGATHVSALPTAPVQTLAPLPTDRLRALTQGSASAAICVHLSCDGDIGLTPTHSATLIMASLGDAVPDEAALRVAVAARVRQDYAEGRTVLLHGWTLAVTEARLAALWRDE